MNTNQTVESSLDQTFDPLFGPSFNPSVGPSVDVSDEKKRVKLILKLEMSRILSKYESKDYLRQVLEELSDLDLNESQLFETEAIDKQAVVNSLYTSCDLSFDDKQVMESLDLFRQMVVLADLEADGLILKDVITKLVQKIMKDMFTETSLDLHSLQPRRQLVIRSLANTSHLYSELEDIIPLIVRQSVDLMLEFRRKLEDYVNCPENIIKSVESENVFYITQTIDYILTDLAADVDKALVTKDKVKCLVNELQQIQRSFNFKTIEDQFPFQLFCFKYIQQLFNKELTKIKNKL